MNWCPICSWPFRKRPLLSPVSRRFRGCFHNEAPRVVHHPSYIADKI